MCVCVERMAQNHVVWSIRNQSYLYDMYAKYIGEYGDSENI